MLDKKIKVIAIIIGALAIIFGLSAGAYRDAIIGAVILTVTWIYSRIKRED